jgi:hypothetical protein
MDGKLIRCFQGGDPYGNRTRVSAVKGENRLKSMRRPPFRAMFRAMFINELQPKGDA